MKRVFSLLSSTALILGMTTLALTVLTPKVQAAGELNLTTSPLPINLKTKPGNTVTAELRVQNSGTQTETLKIDLEKFKAYGEDGKPQLITREPGDDFFDWVQFSQRTFTAEPNVWTSIKMTIKVPQTAAFGYYYAVVFSRVKNETTIQPRSNTIVGGSATLVLLDVDVPNAKKQVDVLEFSADKKLYEFLPSQFRLRLRNSGAVHVAPSGTIFIMRGKKQVSTVAVNSDKGNVLPGSNRIFGVKWSDGFPHYEEKSDNGKVVLDKDGKSQSILKWNFSQILKLRFGHYTAKMVLVYDNGTRDVPVEGTLSFWVVPWRLLGGLLVVIVLNGFGLWFIIRGISRKLKKSAS